MKYYPNSWNIMLNIVRSYLDPVYHHHLQSSPLESSDTDSSTSATNGISLDNFIGMLSTACDSA